MPPRPAEHRRAAPPGPQRPKGLGDEGGVGGGGGYAGQYKVMQVKIDRLFDGARRGKMRAAHGLIN